MNYSPNWDLESIFPGGSHSEKLEQQMEQLKKQTTQFQQLIEGWFPEKDLESSKLTEILLLMQTISDSFDQCGNFIENLMSANTKDTQANVLNNRLFTLLPAIQLAETTFIKKLTYINDDQWQVLITSKSFKPLTFRLNEMRSEGEKLLSENDENIINTLSLDGLKAWSSHYDTIVSSMEIPFKDESGNIHHYSIGQAANKMTSDANKKVRQQLFTIWEQTWCEKAPLFADTLNHLDGFRLSNYKFHKINDFLEQPLKDNRMSKKTLNTLWATIEKNKQPFVDYLTRKAKLFGNDKMEWQDQEAPVILGNLKEQSFSYNQAAAFIIENFQAFSPKMAKFAEMAFQKNWIEAENRPHKRPGGYCIDLPESKESRIFMTFNHSINEVATLAHELGHAFHSSVMWDLPQLNREYAMNVAETASTFAELIVSDATLKKAKTKEEKINLLDNKLQNANAMFMNIHARFLFETNFYTARQKGFVGEEAITELMLQAQKDSYQNCLASYHPHFWASKLHFFIDEPPFYNFPYTFGYLFSMGIYAYANQQKRAFEDHYIALLRDTGSMTSEELAQKHLGVDLTKPDFWQSGIDQVVKDVELFMELTESYI
ncbi:M3 family oligoendopeptidase [Melissococcus plutonius]|uniref:Oligoendopeptidase F n=1 Tax=Melissococcus plutonius TaxID=33970 RepID=A0A2Z5Y113_9ENTE|nr:M3 family oligoendopeptidase [Melissococcus plutonius]BAL61622.1 oligoendopeptidase, PepF/M3 family [Melissococcus plutonius DAT561]MCV2498432.1 M3 family oligoendopeptidase [Melissococcus plutonius]MCV2500561.1 M3 family oligoendopeptidase [Melissococcus plutonius]MCV2504457.1 M3 family oligoendopeptidase [Melissococcus plutonius]MCV2507047.1 M3 family oligoendopeptidase [Melissococcus plutonius]